MGNTPVFYHRLPALASSCLSSLALALLAIAGTTCYFLEVTAKNGQSLVIPDGSEQEDVSSHNIGVLCDSEYYDREGDTMWQLSRAFLIVSLTLGSLCTALAWSVTTFLPPSDANWKALSIASSLTAVLQVPVFLLFESNPCSSYDEEQDCTVSLGCFLLIASTVFWVAVTLVTQCVDPPLWAVELDAWRVKKRREASSAEQSHAFMLSEDCDSMEEVYILQRYSSRGGKSSPFFLRGLQRWMHKRRWANSPHLPLVATESGSRDDEEADLVGTGNVPIDQYPEAGSYYANSNNSRLLLKVMPDGKLPGDDQKSATTFGDLDEFVKLSEDGQLPPSPERLLGEHEDERADLVILQDKTQRSSPQKCLVDEPFGLRDDLYPTSPMYGEEPQIYTDPKAFSTSSDSIEDQSGGSKRCRAFPGESSFDGPGEKISSGIRALTIRVKRMKHGKAYEMMDDDSESSLSSDEEYEEEDNDGEVGNRSRAVGGTYMLEDNDQGLTDESSTNARLLAKWNSMFSLKLGSLAADRSHSSSEEDPEIVCYSSDDALTSLSSLEHKPDDTDDDSSAVSGSSVSDSSDSEARRVSRNAGNREKRFKRRKRRKSRRNLSCGNSVCSRRSLLDTTIDEETVFDLMAFESDDDEELKKMAYPISRTKSAPNAVDGSDSDLSSPHPIRRYSVYGNEFHESQARKSLTDEAASLTGEFSSDYSKSEAYALVRSRSVDGPRPKKGSSSRIFVEERLYMAGIHSPFIAVVSDSGDSSSDASGGNRSVRSNFSRARMARVRRLQRETAGSKQRRRARTLDPPKNRWGGVSTNGCDSPENLAVVEPLHREEYGSDKSSYTAGIRSPSIAVVSDSDDSSSDASGGSRSVRSNFSRARVARVRRLQRETEASKQRRRARTLDPPKNRWGGLSTNSFDSPENLAVIEPLHREEYGSDEASL